MAFPSAKTYAWFLAALRIYAGLFWLSRAIPKFTNPSAYLPPNGSMGLMMTHALAKPGGVHGLFAAVAPNAEIVAQLLRAGELVTGVLLVLGVLTRLGGLLGVLMGGIALLASNVTWISGWSSVEAAGVAISAMMLALPAGRVLGLDALFGRREMLYEDIEMPVPPSRPEPQPTVAQEPAVVARVTPPSPQDPPVPPQPVPNGSGNGPAFGAPASAGPMVDQGRQTV